MVALKRSGQMEDAQVRESHNRPLLAVLHGERIDGDEVLAELTELLTTRLPFVADDDPRRPALVALSLAAGCRQPGQARHLATL